MSSSTNSALPAANAPDGKVYPLRTLHDIFNLPSYEHMERCLAELPKVMLQARAAADLLVGLAEAKGVPCGDLKFGWPESLPWMDDGKGEIGSVFKGTDGAEILEVNVVRSAPGAGGESPLAGLKAPPRT